MWDNIIGRHIRRGNRNLLVINIGLLLLLITGALLTTRYWYNFVLGPFPLERPTLLSTEQPGTLPRYFVTIDGDEAIDTEFQEVMQNVDKYTRKVKSERVTAGYVALAVDDRLLLVKEEVVSSETHLTGALVPMPDDVQRKFIQSVEAEAPELRGVFLPMLLDTTSFHTPGYWSLGLGLPFLGVCLWNITKGIRRSNAFEIHPVGQTLARFGAPAQVATAIAAELQNDPHVVRAGQVQLSTAWLLQKTLFGANVVNLSDLVWVYVKVTQHSYNFIPTSKSYAVVLQLRNGTTIEIGCKKKVAEPLVEGIRDRAPWIMLGHNDVIEQAWKKNRPALLQAVDERRQAVGGALTTPTAL